MEPNEQFGFDWDMTVSSKDCGFEAEPQDLHNTVEGEDAVFELLSGCILNSLSHTHLVHTTCLQSLVSQINQHCLYPCSYSESHMHALCQAVFIRCLVLSQHYLDMVCQHYFDMVCQHYFDMVCLSVCKCECQSQADSEP